MSPAMKSVRNLSANLASFSHAKGAREKYPAGASAQPLPTWCCRMALVASTLHQACQGSDCFSLFPTPCCLSLLPCLRKFFAREASRSVSILSCSSNSGHTINVENCLVTPPNVVCSSKERRPPTAFASISITNILWFAAYETVSQLKANCNRPVDQPTTPASNSLDTWKCSWIPQLDASAFVTCLSRSSCPSKPRPSTAR